MREGHLRNQLCIALMSAFIVGLAGLGFDVLSGARGLANPAFVVSHLGAGVAYFLVIFLCLWAPLHAIVRKLNGSTEAVAAAVATALASYLIAARVLQTPVTVGQFARTAPLPSETLRATLVLVAYSAATASVVFTSWSPRRSSWLRYGPLLIALGFATVAILWTQTFGGGIVAYIFVGGACIAAAASRNLSTGRATLVLCWAALGLVAAGIAATSEVIRSKSPEPRIQGGLARPNVVLITFDTLRADMVQGPTPDRPPTPSFDRLANESVVFENALSAGGWTMPGATSLLTGLCPDVHGRGTDFKALSAAIPTLPERMRSAGYRTATIGRNSLIRTLELPERFAQERWWPLAPFGWSAGPRILSDLVDRFSRHASPEILTLEAAEWLKETARLQETARLEGTGVEPFFLWLHYFEPHWPYAPPRRLVDESLFADSIGWETDRELVDELRLGQTRRLDSAERRWLRELYQGDVRWTDEHLGRTLDKLTELGLFETSWVVVTGDHGEEFFEHGGFEHGQSLYNELLHVPFMMKPPGPPAPGRISTFVSTVSLTPTLAQALSLEETEKSASPSLLESVVNRTEPDAVPIFSSGVRFSENWHAVVFDDYKYIRRDTSGAEELYNLITDPRELKPLDLPDVLAQGRELLGNHLQQAAAIRGQRPGSSSKELDEGSQELLRSLGYIQ